MSETSLIERLFLKSIHSSYDTSDLNQQVLNCIRQKTVILNDLLEHCTWQESLACPEKTIENWKRLLVLNLLNYFQNTHTPQMAQLVRYFEHHPWNQSSQYFRLMIALNHFLAGMPVPEVGLHLLESGAALIDFHEYCPWLSLPYHPFHLELGIFLSALGILAKRPDLVNYVKQLANWQLNAIDANGKPFNSLFTREKDNNDGETMLLSYLFFRGAASFTKERKFSYLSELIGRQCEEKFQHSNLNVQPLWLLFERIFDLSAVQSEAFELPNQIYDCSTSLIGYRTEQQSAVCTLHGGRTGLGYFRDNDVEIMNYGPQYHPLDDCQGFGIEGNHLSDHGVRQSIMEWNRFGFSQKGCIRMVDQPSVSSLHSGIYRGIWIEVAQEYRHSKFQIKTSFLGLDGWESVAFCFFVKADQCQIDQMRLLPGKLERYEGRVFPLTLEGEHSKLELTAQASGNMQVIPLCGGVNFWGAHFLVAYHLDSRQRHYTWSVKALEEPNTK